MTNYYKNLCDRAGVCIKHYPPETAEMILKMQELFMSKGRLSLEESDTGYTLCKLNLPNDVHLGLGDSIKTAIYMLTNKLLSEDILSCEEVAKALKGNHND